MSIKWGIMGTAGIAQGCTIPGLKQAEGCELYAIAGRNEQKVQDFKERFGFEKAYVGYDALLADPDVQAVYIPLPNHLHCEWVIKALQAGKHVLCEKPMAMNRMEAERMFAAAKENGVILMEAYAYLHSPYIAALGEEIHSGVIGEVNYIETAFLTQGYKEDFRLHKEFGGGALYDLGCYCTTMILALLEAQEGSTGLTGKSPIADLVKGCAEFTDQGVDYLTSAILRFENGVRASFQVGMNLGIDYGSRFDRLYIHGSKGSIRSDVEYNQEGELSYRVIADGRETVKTVSSGQNYRLEAEQMIRAIEGRETPHISPEFSLKNTSLLDNILDAIGY